MDDIWEEYRKRLFELKLKEHNEKMMSQDKMTATKETIEEIKMLKKEMINYKLERGKIK